MYPSTGYVLLDLVVFLVILLIAYLLLKALIAKL